MKILMVTWEFPPHKVGGVASHCYDISRYLARAGNEVHILSFGNENRTEYQDGVTVHRVNCGTAPDIVSWVMVLNYKMQKKGIELCREEGFDVVHAHDWLSVPATVYLKKSFKVPMVLTLHSTEYGRSGIHSPLNKMINDIEWFGTYEANEVITVGKDFREEVKNLFSVPEEKLHYIPNGVDLERFRNVRDVRDEFSLDWEKIVLFVGRLCHQKGVEYLIEAMPETLREHPEAKFVIVGKGALDHYRKMVYRKGVDQKVYFTGYVSEEMLMNLYYSADVTVMPSVYEPSGIVAMESMAVRTPVVASYTGGLKETVVHEWCGLHTYPCDPQSIKWGITTAINDMTWNRWLGKNGKKRVEKNYNWDIISKWTYMVYRKAVGEY
ncbi:MAG: glycosyltransferase family 1 protein [Candidatus Aenigmatarchaeota archaeon]|nr:MAG: glycosyltransferase family 1 protein [Candidatus Aenigmarchaeota archaeon]